MRLRQSILFLLLALQLMPSATADEQVQAGEYRIKAAFLYNFGKFIKWPRAAFDDKRSPFVVGVIDQVVCDTVDSVIGKKSIHDRPIKVVCFAPDAVGFCHILFVPRSFAADIPAILEKTTGQRILTASEVPGFATAGGVVNFVLDGDRVQFEINLDRAKLQRLKPSSKLLNLAILVEDDSY